MDPVGGTVASSAEASRIHQGFQQQRTTSISGLPVVGHLPSAQRQDLAGQSLDSYPRQHQKPAIVDDGLQVTLPLLVVPADPGIPRPHLPGRRGPEQTSQLPIAIANPVTQVRAERDAATQIVMALHLLAPQTAFRLAFDQGQFQRLALAGGAFDRRGFDTRAGYLCPPRTPSAQLPQLGKLQGSCCREPLQQLPALVVLQPSAWPLPPQQLADGMCDPGHPESGELRRDLA